MNAKIIWVASMPRSGSMWTYNVTRRLLLLGGVNVEPKLIPKSDEQVFSLANHALQDVTLTSTYVLKIHRCVSPDTPRSFFISVVRDIRDAMVSWMRFMHSDFETALVTATSMTTVVDHYRLFPPEIILHIPYEDIICAPRNVCIAITRALSLEISEQEINSVVEKYSKDNVAANIVKKEQDIMKRIYDSVAITEHEVTQNLDRSLRAFDVETGFQSGHVSSYRDGDWKMLLTQGQQNRMIDVLGDWLEQNGYV